MARYFKKLRDQLFSSEIKQSDLADILGVSTAHVNRMLMGRTQWQSDQMYKVLEVVGGNSLDEYFPKDDCTKSRNAAHRV